MTEKKRYRFAQSRCGRCGTILTEKRVVIAKPDMRGDIPHGKCPGCKKLLPLDVEEELEPATEPAEPGTPPEE